MLDCTTKATIFNHAYFRKVSKRKKLIDIDSTEPKILCEYDFFQAVLPHEWDLSINKSVTGNSSLPQDVMFLSKLSMRLRIYYMPLIISAGLVFNILLIYTLVN